MLRYQSDIKTLCYLVLITAIMVGLYFFHDEINGLLWTVLYASELLLAVSVGVIVHNHRHVPIWKNNSMNLITDCWLTVLYGFPVFGWIPTHLQNHHTYTNKEPDYTKTYAYSEKNNLWTIIYYPMYSSGVQMKAIWKYIQQIRHKNPERFRGHLLQTITLIVAVVVALIFDWKAALIYVVLPQQIALNSVLCFNYIQHIHADEESEFNHSRNIEGWLNVFLFNNGLHTAHHIKPRLHWSKVPQLHAEIRSKISPQLIEKSVIWYLIRQYVLAPFNSSLSTKSMRLARQSHNDRNKLKLPLTFHYADSSGLWHQNGLGCNVAKAPQ